MQMSSVYYSYSAQLGFLLLNSTANNKIISSSYSPDSRVHYSNATLSYSTHIATRSIATFKVHVSEAGIGEPKWWENNVGPNMIDINSTQEFLAALSEAQDRLVVVEFYGTWCASCRALFPKVCKIAQEHPKILFLKVNFDENKPLCKSLNVKVLPYFQFYRGAEGLVDSFSCSLAKLQKLRDAIATHNNCGHLDDRSAESSSR